MPLPNYHEYYKFHKESVCTEFMKPLLVTIGTVELNPRLGNPKWGCLEETVEMQ